MITLLNLFKKKIQIVSKYTNISTKYILNTLNNNALDT